MLSRLGLIGVCLLCFTLCLVHPRPRHTSHEERSQNLLQALMPTMAIPLGIEKFDSNVFHCLILANAFLIWFLHILSLGSLSLCHDWRWVRRWRLHLGPKLSEVHPTYSQSVSLHMIGFEYGHQSIWDPFRPKVGIMAHLVVSDLLIYPFSFKELTHT